MTQEFDIEKHKHHLIQLIEEIEKEMKRAGLWQTELLQDGVKSIDLTFEQKVQFELLPQLKDKIANNRGPWQLPRDNFGRILLDWVGYPPDPKKQKLANLLNRLDKAIHP